MSSRTPAERSVDRLTAELATLRSIANPSMRQRNRRWQIENVKLPAAWQAVNDQRSRER